MTETGAGAGAAPKRSRWRRVARLALLNALVLLAGALLAGGGAEVYFRVTTPFRDESLPVRFVPGVGLIRPPNVEVRATNGLDFWQATHTNSLGFLDREPPAPERAATSCHVAFIGDSFVEAKEVPVASKAHVHLEKMAMREAPELDVTTSAFGRSGTGQLNQLAFYDAWVRSRSPNLVALVFVPNDFHDSSLALASVLRGFEPDHPPFLFAERAADGAVRLKPPSPGFTPPPPGNTPRATGRWGWLRDASYFADWLARKYGSRSSPERDADLVARAESLSSTPRFSTLLDGWVPSTERGMLDVLLEDPLPPAFVDAVAFASFALEQFRQRTDRDNADLVILASYLMGGEGDPLFERLRALAADVEGGGGIPVISQADHVITRGGEIEDLHWANDRHWNAAGHRWAAGALLEWLKRNPEVCDD